MSNTETTTTEAVESAKVRKPRILPFVIILIVLLMGGMFVNPYLVDGPVLTLVFMGVQSLIQLTQVALLAIIVIQIVRRVVTAANVPTVDRKKVMKAAKVVTSFTSTKKK